MKIVLCPDTRRMSPEEARKNWWEIQLGAAQTTPRARAAGWPAVCSTLDYLAYGKAPELGPLMGGDFSQFRTESAAQSVVYSVERQIRSIPHLSGPAAQAERTRVWRV